MLALFRRTTPLLILLTRFTADAQPPGGGPGQSGDGIWLRNAYYGERITFDSCLGHQPGTGDYHYHAQPICLRAQLDDNLDTVATGRTGSIYRERTTGLKHSPILGWAFDGYPIYGPYSYSDPKNTASPIRRMRSSFRLRNISERTSLPDWLVSFHSPVPQQLAPTQYGPPVNRTFPLGRYAEDYDYVAGLGDLDQYNGRFTITPQYPNGTYAYFVTIDDAGAPQFPYVLSRFYYGVVAASGGPGPGVGSVANVPADAQDFNSAAGATDPLLSSFPTKNAANLAQAVIGWDPSAGPQTTWPGTQPKGAAQPSGGVSSPVTADVQRIRSNATNAYINANGLPSYVIGPWFAEGNGGVFNNFPSKQNFQVQIPRAAQPATITRTATPMGAAGIWVNGVAAFNFLDGASYRTSTGVDVGGGPVTVNAIHWSAASLEGGPVTPGSLVSAFANFDAVLATSTEQATSANWPTSLGGATVNITDSAGTTFPAPIFYASPTQINYRVPTTVALGVASVRITANGVNIPGSLNIAQAYPGVFKVNAEGLAAAQVARLKNGQLIYDNVAQLQGGTLQPAPFSVATAAENATLVLYASGLNGAKDVTATVGGTQLPLAYAGPQGTYDGLDQINIPLPVTLAGKGKVAVIVTAGGKKSNPVFVTIQ